MKILVWEDGRVWLTYNGVEFLRRRNLTQDLAANISVIDALSAKVSE